MISVALFSIFVSSLLIYYFHVRKPTNFPPGPRPYPIVGNLPSLAPHLHVAFEEMSMKYGPIVGVKFGNQNTVCIHGFELIKEAWNEGTFTGRLNSEAISFINGDENGILSAAGETSKEQRRFALRHLRDFGFGKVPVQDMILEEVLEFSHWLKQQNGRPVTLQSRFQLAVVNSLWRIIAGERFDHDDSRLHKILEDLQESANAIFEFTSAKTLCVFFYPLIGRFFPNWSGWNRLEANKRLRMSMFTKIIKEHKETFHEDVGRDFVDVYLREISKTTNPASVFNPKTGDESLKSVMADFFLAGTDTTAVSLSWLNLYLLHHPRVQEKLHQELDRVVGRSRPANMGDRKSLVYTEAVVLETLRLSSIVQLSVPHVTLSNVKFHGYDIPKGTMVFANLYSNHHDPQIWGQDVEEFRPERFLSPDGKTVIRHEAFIPFSIGKRACLGETLARDTLFLFAANLALNFEVTVRTGEEYPPLQYKTGQATLAPVNSTVVMKERNL